MSQLSAKLCAIWYGLGKACSLSRRGAFDCFTHALQWCATSLSYKHIEKKLLDGLFFHVSCANRQPVSDAKATSVLRLRERHIIWVLKSAWLQSRCYYEFKVFRYHDVIEKHHMFVTAQTHNEHQEHLQVNEVIQSNTTVKLSSNKCNNRSTAIPRQLKVVRIRKNFETYRFLTQAKLC